jgi:hypothetical protein
MKFTNLYGFNEFISSLFLCCASKGIFSFSMHELASSQLVIAHIMYLYFNFVILLAKTALTYNFQALSLTSHIPQIVFELSLHLIV